MNRKNIELEGTKVRLKMIERNVPLDGSPVKPIRSTPDLASSGGEDKLKAEVGGGRVHFDLTKNKRASIAGSSPSTVTNPSSTSSQSGSRRFSQASNYSALPHDARQRLEEMVRVRRLGVGCCQ